MANMKNLTQDDRAKLARAYMRGGTPPYQAARQTGFLRVGLMQEAIAALERKEAAETASVTPPAESAPEETATPAKEVIYPFLKPGQVALDPKKRPVFSIQNRDFSIKEYDGTDGPTVQITLQAAPDRYLRIAPEKLGMLACLLRMAEELAAERMEDK